MPRKRVKERNVRLTGWLDEAAPDIVCKVYENLATVGRASDCVWDSGAGQIQTDHPGLGFGTCIDFFTSENHSPDKSGDFARVVLGDFSVAEYERGIIKAPRSVQHFEYYPGPRFIEMARSGKNTPFYVITKPPKFLAKEAAGMEVTPYHALVEEPQEEPPRKLKE